MVEIFHRIRNDDDVIMSLRSEDLNLPENFNCIILRIVVYFGWSTVVFTPV